MTPVAALKQSLNQLGPRPRVGVAVSGGSDSMALLVLAIDYASAHDCSLHVATVDHGLRPAAADEAKAVAAFCAARSIPHKTLTWRNWNGEGNTQAAARTARYGLLKQWAEDQSVDTVLLGHTSDDQAETILLALARGSGVDGLTGMPDKKDALFLRPLLNVDRVSLRDVLRNRGISWSDDPSNDDKHYDRVKARQMMDHLSQLGLTLRRLVETAGHMQRAQCDLKRLAKDYSRQHVTQIGPDLMVPKTVMASSWSDHEPRVFAAALMWISGAPYRPRFAALRRTADGLFAGGIKTLHGVKLVPEGDMIRLHRELAACESAITVSAHPDHVVWDRRWVLEASDTWPPNTTIQAVGAGLSDVPDWRDAGLPYASAQATPGIFAGETLVAAPALGFSQGFLTRFVADFHSSPVFH